MKVLLLVSLLLSACQTMPNACSCAKDGSSCQSSLAGCSCPQANQPKNEYGKQMPTYEYKCNDCGNHFDVIKSMKDYDNPAECQACHETNTSRLISNTSFYGAGGWDSVSFNPGLGCITKNTKHAEKIARERNLIPVGNENCDKISASQDKKLDDNISEITKPGYDAIEHGVKEHYLRNR